MIATWEQLAELRRKGQAPALPLIVTTSSRLAWNLVGVGTMTIIHEAGTPMPVWLLASLDVILMFDTCGHAAGVARILRAKDIQPSRCRAWCGCEQCLTTCIGDCQSMRDLDASMERAT